MSEGLNEGTSQPKTNESQSCSSPEREREREREREAGMEGSSHTMTTEPLPGDSRRPRKELCMEGSSHTITNKPVPGDSSMITEESINLPLCLKDKLFRIERETTNVKLEGRGIPIPRVPLWLRENKAYSECFDPAVVSIGPYHHGNPKLARIEELKIISAQRFVAGCWFSMGVIYRKLESLTSEAKKYYDDSIMANFNNEAFTVMMFLDGCFILDFIQQVEVGGEWNMLMTLGNDIPLISRDLFLLENQLPYLILKKLVECNLVLEDMVNSYINSEIGKTYGKCRVYTYINSEIGETSMPSSPSAGQNRDQKMPSSPSVGQNHNQKMRSLPCIVDIFRAKLVSKPLSHSESRQDRWKQWEQLKQWEKLVQSEKWEEKQLKEGRRQQREQMGRRVQCVLWVQKQLREGWRQQREQMGRLVQCVLRERWEQRERWERWERSKQSYPPVKELLAKGITFKRKNSICLSDVEFRTHLLGGELLLPQIEINHYTKERFLNLIAYELSYDIPEDHAFIAFICFLDTLIDHAEDVKVLRSEGIICNYLGSDEEVANLINQLATGLTPGPSAYSKVAHQIHYHIKKKWRVYIGEFMHTYFRSPWTTIALIAAGYVIFLTSIQTFFTVFPQ